MALWHSSNKGKTETLVELAAYLQWRYNPAIRVDIPYSPSAPIDPSKKDIRCKFQIGGLVVAIDSEGDPNTGLDVRLLELVTTHNADVIFCASRTRGDTVDAVEKIHKNNGYELIWTSTYHLCAKGCTTTANRVKAQHMVELMQQLGHLP